jgi:hypothetical protein
VGFKGGLPLKIILRVFFLASVGFKGGLPLKIILRGEPFKGLSLEI